MLAVLDPQECRPQNPLQCGKQKHGGIQYVPACQAASAAEALLAIAGYADLAYDQGRDDFPDSKSSPSSSPSPPGSEDEEETDCEDDSWVVENEPAGEETPDGLMLLSRSPPRRALSESSDATVSDSDGVSETTCRKRGSSDEIAPDSTKRLKHEQQSNDLGEITIGIYTKAQRLEKIRRYQEKKAKRKFNKKVIYHCRKAFADRRPRVGGRFVSSKLPSSPPAISQPPAVSSSRRGRPRKSRGEEGAL